MQKYAKKTKEAIKTTVTSPKVILSLIRQEGLLKELEQGYIKRKTQYNEVIKIPTKQSKDDFQQKQIDIKHNVRIQSNVQIIDPLIETTNKKNLQHIEVLLILQIGI